MDQCHSSLLVGGFVCFSFFTYILLHTSYCRVQCMICNACCSLFHRILLLILPVWHILFCGIDVQRRESK